MRYQWFGQRINPTAFFRHFFEYRYFWDYLQPIAFHVISLISFVTGLFLKPKN